MGGEGGDRSTALLGKQSQRRRDCLHDDEEGIISKVVLVVGVVR